MDADTSLGTRSPRRHRSLPNVRMEEDPAAGRPVPSVRFSEEVVPRALRRRASSDSPRTSNLAASFPLFFFGAGCVASATFVLLEGSRAAIGRIPLWLPFLALGVIALVGGTLSVFAEPDEPTEGPPLPPRPPTVANRTPAYSGRTRPVPARVSSVLRPTRPAPIPSAAPRPAPLPVRPPVSVPPPELPVFKALSPAAPLTPRMVDDASSLLREIDLIDADLHPTRFKRAAAPPTSGARAPISTPQAATPSGLVVGGPVRRDSWSPSAEGKERRGSEAPRQVAHCVGCGSVILHSGTAAQCQVCGEPLCSDCRDRSLSEGKPNLCPLCSLLDSVHSKGTSAARVTRPRT